jgi:hypothetical protein
MLAHRVGRRREAFDEVGELFLAEIGLNGGLRQCDVAEQRQQRNGEGKSYSHIHNRLSQAGVPGR